MRVSSTFIYDVYPYVALINPHLKREQDMQTNEMEHKDNKIKINIEINKILILY